jgi:hypothetical protein
MVWIPGGTFRMGSPNFYPEERPVQDVTVDGFWMDRDEVTNDQGFDGLPETNGTCRSPQLLDSLRLWGWLRSLRRNFIHSGCAGTVGRYYRAVSTRLRILDAILCFLTGIALYFLTGGVAPVSLQKITATTGAIKGSVSDSTKAVVPGAFTDLVTVSGVSPIVDVASTAAATHFDAEKREW